MRRRGQFCVGGPSGGQKVSCHVEQTLQIIMSYPRACWLTTYACYAAPPTLKIRICNPHKMRRWGLITRVNRMPSKLVYNWSAQTNFPPTHLQPTPTGRAQIFARFRTFTNFFKNVPDYRNRSNFARGPFLTYSSIWKKNLGVRKKSVIPYFQAPNRLESLVKYRIRKILHLSFQNKLKKLTVF